MQSNSIRSKKAFSKESLPAVIIAVILLLCVAVGARVVHELSYRSVAEPGRDYSLNPFSELDATMACRDEAKRRRGKLLLSSYVDELSTRFDEKIGAYIVVLRANIGVNNDFEEHSIVCYLYPTTQRLTNYDEIPLKKGKEQNSMRFFK